MLLQVKELPDAALSCIISFLDDQKTMFASLPLVCKSFNALAKPFQTKVTLELVKKPCWMKEVEPDDYRSRDDEGLFRVTRSHTKVVKQFALWVRHHGHHLQQLKLIGDNIGMAAAVLQALPRPSTIMQNPNLGPTTTSPGGLQWLFLHDTYVTDADFDLLAETCPGLKVLVISQQLDEPVVSDWEPTPTYGEDEVGPGLARFLGSAKLLRTLDLQNVPMSYKPYPKRSWALPATSGSCAFQARGQWPLTQQHGLD